ncbi:MAG: YraN family protein [Prevotellaceae bacterium]|jgi:putative endonuclease|nr:YraN family protein [Prevotellaceae bacterium]
MTDKQNTGKAGEQIAADYLRNNGFNILHINWRQGQKELDIVAKKNNRLHVVEVRSLKSNFFMEPYQSINKAKQRHLIAATNAYIQRYKLTMEAQIDVISIVFSGDGHTLEYLPNAIYPGV